MAQVTASNPAPATPVVTLAPYFNAIEVFFDKPVDPDFAGCRVYVSTSSGFTPNSSNLQYDGPHQKPVLVSGLLQATTYYVKVIAYDVFGDSAVSTQVSTTTTSIDDETPPTIPNANLAPTVTGIVKETKLYSTGELKIAWTASTDDSGKLFYRVEYWKTADATKKTVVETTDLQYTVYPAEVGVQYAAHVMAVDYAGNESAYTPTTNYTITADGTAPANVSGVILTAQFSSVLVEWTNPSDADFIETKVYRGTSSGFTPNDGTNLVYQGRANAFLDADLVNGTAYYYKFKTRDVQGNESTASAASGPVTPFAISVTNIPSYISDGAIKSGSLTVLATQLVNPVSQTGVLNGWGATLEDGSGSPVRTSYDATENAIEYTSSGNDAIRSQTWRFDHDKIYRISFKLKKDQAHGTWYVGVWENPTPANGAETNGSGGNFDQFDQNRASLSSGHLSASNAYFVTAEAASTSYVDRVVYLVGANRDVNECPNHVGSGEAPYIKALNIADNVHVGLRFLNWSNSVLTSLFIKDVSVTELGSGYIVASNIVAGTITANEIAAATITGDKIAASTITAAKLSVSQLSAISADMGAITAGTITGATIRTSSSNPKVQLDSTNGIQAYDAGGVQRVSIQTSGAGYFGSASGISWTAGGAISIGDATVSGILTGGTIRTSASNPKVQLDSTNGVQAINSGGTTVAKLGTDGSGFIGAGSGSGGISWDTAGAVTFGGLGSEPLFFSRTNTITTLGAGSIIIPTGARTCVIRVWGGCGSGAKSNPDTSNGGGGGGGGSKKTISIQSTDWGQSISFNIGGGGAGVNVVGSGNAGTQTTVTSSGLSFTNLNIDCNGGNAGTTAAGGSGGTASGGDTNVTGSSGTFGSNGVGGNHALIDGIRPGKGGNGVEGGTSGSGSNGRVSFTWEG